jgi:hypothetical protein
VYDSCRLPKLRHGLTLPRSTLARVAGLKEVRGIPHQAVGIPHSDPQCDGIAGRCDRPGRGEESFQCCTIQANRLPVLALSVSRGPLCLTIIFPRSFHEMPSKRFRGATLRIQKTSSCEASVCGVNQKVAKVQSKRLKEAHQRERNCEGYKQRGCIALHFYVLGAAPGERQTTMLIARKIKRSRRAIQSIPTRPQVGLVGIVLVRTPTAGLPHRMGA